MEMRIHISRRIIAKAHQRMYRGHLRRSELYNDSSLMERRNLFHGICIDGRISAVRSRCSLCLSGIDQIWRNMGATGGIGGTYAVMPELFIKARKLFYDGKVKDAYLVQNEICRIIYKICEAHGNLYAVQKSILARKGILCGGVRKPLPALIESDLPIVNEAAAMIDAAIEKYC